MLGINLENVDAEHWVGENLRTGFDAIHTRSGGQLVSREVRFWPTAKDERPTTVSGEDDI
jgi:hypothetical protein